MYTRPSAARGLIKTPAQPDNLWMETKKLANRHAPIFLCWRTSYLKWPMPLNYDRQARTIRQMYVTAPE
jgi:hypothetical protein